MQRNLGAVKWWTIFKNFVGFKRNDWITFIIFKNIVMSLNHKIRKLDVFKKVPKDLSEGTNIGGCISILTLCLMIYFSVS